MADVPTAAKISDLIGQIYDASLNPRLWDEFLITLAGSFGSEQALILNVDTKPGPCGLLRPLNMDLAVVAEWEGSKEHIDPWYMGVQQVKQDSVYVGDDFCPTAELRKGPFYVDMLSRLNIVHSLGGVSFESDARNWVFTIYHDKSTGEFSEKQKEIFALLVPHFGRAIKSSQLLGRLRAENAALRGALETSPFGVFLLDQEGYVCWQNQVAEDLALECDGLTIRYGELRFWDFETEKQFRRQVNMASNALDSPEADFQQFLRVPRPSGKFHYQVMATPVSSAQTNVFANAACVVTVHDPVSQREISSRLLEQLYNLTPAEAKICVALFETGTLAEALETLQTSRNTAKTHLARIFSKLGVKSQAQLLQLLALGFRKGRPAK